MDQSLCKTFVTSALSSGEIYPTEGKEMGTMLGLFSFFAEWSFSLSERVTDEAFLKPKNNDILEISRIIDIFVDKLYTPFHKSMNTWMSV